MLNVNQLTGFGVAEAAAAGYRYLRLYVSTSNSFIISIGEINWVTGGTDYPTQTMTSNTAPSPLVASANSEYSPSTQAWNAMDNVNSTYWENGWYVFPCWHTIDLGSGNAINPTAIVITPINGTSYLITAFSCYGSNTGAFAGEEVFLGSFSPGASGWTALTRRTFTF